MSKFISQSLSDNCRLVKKRYQRLFHKVNGFLNVVRPSSVLQWLIIGFSKKTNMHPIHTQTILLDSIESLAHITAIVLQFSTAYMYIRKGAVHVKGTSCLSTHIRTPGLQLILHFITEIYQINL